MDNERMIMFANIYSNTHFVNLNIYFGCFNFLAVKNTGKVSEVVKKQFPNSLKFRWMALMT